MGIFDRAKDVLGQHPDQVERGVDQLADLVEDRTGHQHSAQVDRGAEAAKEKLEDYLGRDQPPA